MGYCYNRLTIHASVGFTKTVVDAWNNGDVCVALSERYAADMHSRRDRPVRDIRLARQARIGIEEAIGRTTLDPVVSASSDGTSVHLKFSTTSIPTMLRNMIVPLLGNKVAGFRLLSTDPSERFVYAAKDWQTNHWNVVCNSEWIRERVHSDVAEECNLESWVEEEGG
jgi:hypothetical protein